MAEFKYTLPDIIHPLKYTFGYATGFIFLLGIVIYLYLLITDHLEDPNQHSVEETIWMYLFLVVMIIGLALSYYSITCAIYCVKESNDYGEYRKKLGGSFGFGGSKMNIPTRPSVGLSKIIRSARFIV
jgi:hypothetical protein